MGMVAVGNWGRGNNTNVDRTGKIQTFPYMWVPPWLSAIFPKTLQESRSGKDGRKVGGKVQTCMQMP